MNPIALDCVAVLGVLLFAQGPIISVLRGRSGHFHGYQNDPSDPLYKWVRAHGNTAEYAAFLAVLLLWLGAHNPPDWVVWSMALVTLCRVLFVAGMVIPKTMATPNPLRFVGALGTYVFGLALVAGLFAV